MSGNALVKYLAAGNASEFNRLRLQNGSPTSLLLTIANQSFAKINFRPFRLSNLLYTDCEFRNCTFDNLTEVRFFKCTFHNCTFYAESNREGLAFDAVIFFECKHIGGHFGGPISNLTFHRCRFEKCDFKGAIFRNKLKVMHSIGFASSRNLLYSNREVTDVEYVGNREGNFQRLTDWETLRFLLAIPITKVSWLYFLFNAAILYTAYSAQRAGSRLSTSAFASYPIVRDLTDKLDEFLRNGAVLHSASQNILFSLILLAGSIIFSFSCPHEIKSYDRRKWIYEIGQRSYVYEHIAMFRAFPRFLATVLLLIGVGFVAKKYTVSVVTVLSKLFLLALQA